MSKNKIAKQIYDVAEPIADELGYELVDVEYVKEASNWYLRIYIDKPEGITIEDCTNMNSKIDPILDELDLIPHAYTFEVCSPGLDRPLKTDRDFVKYKGELVEVRLYKPQDGSKRFEGELVGRKDGIITIITDKGEMNFSQDKVAVIKRVITF